MRYLILVLVMCLWPLSLIGQKVLQTKNQVFGYQTLLSETVFVHSNTSFLLTGEYLFYKVYCFDTSNNGLTTFSKVAYVELVGEDGTLIFKQKILLNEGQGHGDFFIPTEVTSGAYKLIAYTNWMRNQNQNDFYQADLTIVNPYRSNQPELQKNNSILVDSTAIDLNDTVASPMAVEVSQEDSGPLQLTVSGEIFSKRAKVIVTLQSKEMNKEISGSYSVSVRKKDVAATGHEDDTMALSVKGREQTKKTSLVVGNSIVLPELRGELFQGKVTALEDGLSVDGLKVGVSIPGEDYVLELVQTDILGNFHVNLSKSYSGETMFLQVISENPEAYEVRINELGKLDYAGLDFQELDIPLSMREEILQRSIHNQIENSYFQFRPDSVLTILPKQFFDNKPKKRYLLDDYTRFTTLRETLIEIIQDVSSKRIGKDNLAIRVKGYNYASVADIPPLIVLDGCLIQDHNALLAFDTRIIEVIEVYRQQFVFGPELYEGALFLYTKDGNAYESLQDGKGISSFNLLKPQADKKYFTQRYNELNGDEANERLPDDRLQLLWMPKLKLEDGGYQISFFTSDVTGAFEIRLEGITDDSKPISIRRTILVE